MATAPNDQRQYDPELAARLRAAIAYAGLGVEEAAEQLDTSARTLYRMTRAQGPIRIETQEKVAKLTGVPLWFLRQGFEPERDDDDVDITDRVDRLQNQMDTVLRILRGRVATDLVQGDPGQEGHEDPRRNDDTRRRARGGAG